MSDNTIPVSLKWSVQHILVFLECYEDYELLWNVHHDDYANKMKRERATLALKSDLIELGLPVPDLTFLRARVKAVKTTYKMEALKILESKKSGDVHVYKPKLQWFNAADKFLRCIIPGLTNQSDLDTTTNGNEEEKLTFIEQDEDGSAKKSRRLARLSSVRAQKRQKISEPSETPSVTPSSETEVINTNPPSTDQFQAFGNQVGLRIRDLTSQNAQKIAKHLISNILFEAEMGKYDSNPFSATNSPPFNPLNFVQPLYSVPNQNGLPSCTGQSSSTTTSKTNERCHSICPFLNKK
ncbi:uncharacterized protein LOC111045462 [Nilaparvata lugens]|uniref:uncharacterized protein LOC111045462 n=1 Tax=Nilaparvata lugens TaxID=108931 RepID=UPI00193E826F|nr:uncharacterized protein LOC111045462 [Nilaparvata lugens]